MQHLGLSDVRQLENLRPDELGRLRIFLKGVVIKVTLSNSRPRPIKDLVGQAGLQEFDKENERWTVAVSRRCGALAHAAHAHAQHSAISNISTIAQCACPA